MRETSLEHLLAAIHTKLFAASSLTSLVGTRIEYSRGVVDTVFPQVIYFDVTDVPGGLVDYNRTIIQFSCFANDKYTALQMRSIIYNTFVGFNGDVSVSGGTVHINNVKVNDAGQLPDESPDLFGHYLRLNFGIRGINLGGF